MSLPAPAETLYSAGMNAQSEQSVDDVIQSLIDYDSIKVWSWLTTIFGDMARRPDAELSGAVLSVLTGAVGLRPQAMRVAIHRLRKDGWIIARREGRNSHYRLTDAALAETVAASERIYAVKVEAPPRWHLLVVDPAAREQAGLVDGYLKVAEASYLGIGPRPTECRDAIAVDVARADIPAWAMRAAVPAELALIYARFSEVLSGVECLTARDVEMSAVQQATLRLLTLHHWRRAALRSTPVIDALAGDDWIGAACRRRSAKIFDKLPVQSPEALTGSAD